MRTRFKPFSTLVVLLTLLTLVAFVPAAPASAQTDTTLTLTGEDLQARFTDYVTTGFSLNYATLVRQVALSLRDGEIVISFVMENSAESTLLQNPTTTNYEEIKWTVILTTVASDGVVSWGFAYAEAQDEAGNPVELAQPQMRAVGSTIRTAMNLAFEDAVRAALRSQGIVPTGQPSLNLEIEQTANVMIIELQFDSSRPMRFGLDSVQNPLTGLVDWQSDLSRGMGEGTITVTPDQLNTAFSYIVKQVNGLDYLTITMTNARLTYTLGLTATDGQSNTLLVNASANPNAVPYETPTLMGPLGSGQGWITLDSVQFENGESVPQDHAQRAADIVMRATNQNLTAQIDGLMIGGLNISDGGMQWKVGNGANVTRSEGESIVITEAQFNQAAASFSLNFEKIEWMKVSLAGDSVRFEMSAKALCNNEVIGAAFNIAPPPVNENGLIIFIGSEGVTCGGKPIEPGQAQLGNFEIQDLMSTFFGRVVLYAAGSQNLIALEQDGVKQAIILTVG